MQSFYAKWLGDIVTSANADGSIPSVAPANGGQNSWRTDPAWGTAYPQIIWDTYQSYGGTRPITDNYAPGKGVGGLPRARSATPTTWSWARRPPGVTTGSASVSRRTSFFQTGFSYLDASLLAKMARVVRQPGRRRGTTARSPRRSRPRPEQALVRRGQRRVRQRHRSSSYAMPLVLGCVPAGREQATVDRLVRTSPRTATTSPPASSAPRWCFQALGAYGRNDVALAIAERDRLPELRLHGRRRGPAPSGRSGRTPRRRTEHRPRTTSGSAARSASGSTSGWPASGRATASGAGSGTASGADAGYRELTLAPGVVGDLTSVSGTQQTARGTVVSSWQRDGATLTYHA